MEELLSLDQHLSNSLYVLLTLQGKIKSLEQIYLFSLPVKEFQIVETFLGSALKDEVMKIMPVQKQTRAGSKNSFQGKAQTLSCSARLLVLLVPLFGVGGTRTSPKKNVQRTNATRIADSSLMLLYRHLWLSETTTAMLALESSVLRR